MTEPVNASRCPAVIRNRRAQTDYGTVLMSRVYRVAFAPGPSTTDGLTDAELEALREHGWAWVKPGQTRAPSPRGQLDLKEIKPGVLKMVLPPEGSVSKFWQPEIDWWDGLPLTFEQRDLLQTAGVKIEAPAHKMADCFGLTTGPWFVSAPLRRIIERLDPGNHDFVEMTVFSSTENRFSDRSFILWKDCVPIDGSVNEDLSPTSSFVSEWTKQEHFVLNGMRTSDWCFRRSVVGLRPFFRDQKFKQHLMCDERFVDACNDEGIMSFEFRPCQLV